MLPGVGCSPALWDVTRQLLYLRMAPASERMELLVHDSQQDSQDVGDESGTDNETGCVLPPQWRWWLMRFIIDLAASYVFWWALLSEFPDYAFYSFLIALVLAMMLWRIYRYFHEEKSEMGQRIPYTCAHLNANDRDLFLVATVHISPRAPKDVETVIHAVKPEVAMIELDEERLDRMRQVPAEQLTEPPETALQQVVFKAPAQHEHAAVEITTHAQRAVWNSEATGQQITGEVLHRAEDEFGLEAGDSFHGGQFMALVRRGGAQPEQFAPFALKAHNAAQSGASALLVVNSEEKLPVGRIGVATIWGELRIACTTGSCSFPSVPVLLLNKQQGEELLQLCRSGRSVTGDFTVKSDPYPRRSLPKKLCQACGLFCSGIGVMYGIIQCFAVEVGGEFLAAELAARDIGIRCVCIDVDLNRFWSRLGWSLLPTPCNLLNSLLSWLAFPRVFFQFLFPPFGSIDTVGSIFLHGASFSVKTWLAFLLAGACASFITNSVLRLFGTGVVEGATDTGLIESDDREEAQAYVMLAIEMYMLPQVYSAVAASRDEAMYHSMVRKCQEFAAKRLVVVVGAGHANGILQYAREFGL